MKEVSRKIQEEIDRIAKELKRKPHSEHNEYRINGRIEGLQMAIEILKKRKGTTGIGCIPPGTELGNNSRAK